MLTLSKSKIKSLIDCPLKFRFNYIDDPKPEKDTILDDKYLIAGLEIHDRLDKIYDKIDEQKYKNMDIIEKIEYLDDLFGDAETENLEANEIINIARKNFIEYQINLDKEFNKDLAKPYKKELFAKFIITDNFIKKFIEPRKDSTTGKKIRNLNPLNEDILIRGYIDRIDQFPDNTYGILDYKSKTTSVTIWELSGYMLMASIHLNLPEINKIGCWGYKDSSYFYRPVKVQNIDYFLFKVLEFKNNYDKYQKLGRWPRKRGFMCRFCEWQKLCKKYNSQGELKK